MAYESLAMISSALSRLESGQLGIVRLVILEDVGTLPPLHTCCRFGENAELLHGFDKPFSATAGAHVLQHLSFTQTRTNFVEVCTYHFLVAQVIMHIFLL